jgi:CheY-like chemotaxis protein
MGGRISVESVVGEGSTFTVDLPLERLPDDAALTSFESAPEPDPAYQPGDRPVRLLAAEDNHINQLVLKTLLHQIGISPVFADNGRDALHAWTLQDWDIILMDMQMPVMDGLAASRYIREQEGLTGRPRTPIIALTANAMSHHIEDYRAAGMDAFVSKPIGIAKLLEAISSILGETSETRAAGEDGAPRALAASSDFAPQP